MQAYSYSITHLPTGKIYYGIRKSSDFDLFKKYFTSSRLVKRLIDQDGLDAFEFKLRKKFDSYEKARLFETKLLQKINAISNQKMLNQAISSPRVCSKDSKSEEIRRQKIREAAKKRNEDPEYRKKHKEACNTKKFRENASENGKLGNIKSLEVRRANPKPKKPKTYKQVEIFRGTERKIVKSNQVPAYRKSGWERV